MAVTEAEAMAIAKDVFGTKREKTRDGGIRASAIKEFNRCLKRERGVELYKEQEEAKRKKKETSSEGKSSSSSAALSIIEDGVASKAPEFVAREMEPVVYTHREIDPIKMLSIIASLTPFQHHNQSHRCMYQ